MQKLLLFILVLLAIYWLRRWLQRPPGARQSPGESSRETAVERMCECRHCGLLVPESEAVRVGAQHYCSLEHARLGEPEERR